MIADQCKKLKSHLEEVAKSNEREIIVQQLEGPQADLKEIRDAVLAANESLAALKRRTSTINGTIDGTKAFERVKQLRETLASDAGSLTKGRNLTNTKKAFEKISKQTAEAIETTWEQYKSKAQPTPDANQIGQAEQQEAYRNDVAQLKAAFKTAEQIGRRAPANEDEFIELENTWNHIRQLIERLPVATDDPDVKKFLRAVNSREGATLDLLNAAVQLWLEENKSTHKYRIHNI